MKQLTANTMPVSLSYLESFPPSDNLPIPGISCVEPRHIINFVKIISFTFLPDTIRFQVDMTETSFLILR